MARINQELQSFTNGTACPSALFNGHALNSHLEAVVLYTLPELLQLGNAQVATGPAGIALRNSTAVWLTFVHGSRPSLISMMSL